jgi:amidase
MTAAPLHTRAACEIADAVGTRELSATEVLEHHLDRIERLNDMVGAFVFRDPTGARAAARDIDARLAHLV